jgi:transposase
MKRRVTRRRMEINLDELDGILDRSTTAPLSKAESQKLKAALHALADGCVQKRSTEKMKSVLPAREPEADSPATGPSGNDKVTVACGHGRNGAAAFAGAMRVSTPHATLQPGQACPECGQGKVYRQKDPATLVRIVGHAPLQTTVFEMDRLRCNACGQMFTAAVPEAAAGEKYDVTAIAMIALLKYGTGVPFKRLEKLESQLAMPLPAATQWELMAAAAKLLWYVLEELIRQAAQGSILHNDDTSMRVLRITRELGDKRRGTFTSGIVSLVAQHETAIVSETKTPRRIALFFTGTKHAGENIADVLKRRARDLPAPIQMCDALARNAPKPAGVRTLLANCLAHGRRQILEVAENFPAECRYVLEILGGVYRNDALAREQQLSAEERLRLHQQHSKPLMQELHTSMNEQLNEHKVEPNSGLGKAFSYLLNHWTKLTLFLSQPGAPLDNNIVERSLKKAILNRRNALFYRTLKGAAVGDLFMGLIHTCELNGANPFDYLTELLRHAEHLKQQPSAWMPWNYRDALAGLPTAA